MITRQTLNQHNAAHRSVNRAHWAMVSTVLLLCLGGAVLSLPDNTVNNKEQHISTHVFTPTANDTDNIPTDHTTLIQDSNIDTNAQLAEIEFSLLNTLPNANHNFIDDTQLDDISDASLQWKQIKIKPGDTLSSIFSQVGLSANDLHKVLTSDKRARLFTQLRPGQALEFTFDKTDQLHALSLETSPLETHIITRNNGQYQYQNQHYIPGKTSHFAQITIKNSLFVDGNKMGLSDNVIMELANLFAWDIDLALDLRPNDQFNLQYEMQSLEGKTIGSPTIMAAELITKNKTYHALRYINDQGQAGYYNKNGQSLRKAFLRAPVEFARISSHFSRGRKHPVLHKIRAHKGTDYAARRGTPILATGNGKISFAGRKGGYGNTITIQHGKSYKTLYAHLSKFAKGIRKGKAIKQGQVIGYVGSTGLATGPHLHYEFHVNGKPRNPITVKLPNGSPIPSKEKQQFLSKAKRVLAQLDQYRNSYQVAQTESISSNKSL